MSIFFQKRFGGIARLAAILFLSVFCQKVYPIFLESTIIILFFNLIDEGA
jgi:hypothetical protein